MGNDRKYRLHARLLLKTLCVVLMTWLCAALFTEYIVYQLTSFSYMSETEKDADYISSDYGKLFVWKRDSTLLNDKDVVVISIAGAGSRDSLAMLLRQVREAKPKAIGIDLFFKVQGVNDSLLLSEIAKTENIVLAYDTFHEQWSYFQDSLPGNSRLGTVNIVKNRREGTCRSFQPFWGDGEPDNIAVELASIYNPDAVDVLRRRGNSHEDINFTHGRPLVIDAEDVAYNQELIEGKIALIGITDGNEDRHFTPVNPDMYGVLLHAYSISTILDKSYYKETPDWVILLISIALCSIYVYIKLRMETLCKDEHKKDEHKNNKYKHMVMSAFVRTACTVIVRTAPFLLRLLQMVIMAALLVGVCLLFSFTDWSVDVAQPVLFIALSEFASDVCDGIGVDALLNKIFKTKTN